MIENFIDEYEVKARLAPGLIVALLALVDAANGFCGCCSAPNPASGLRKGFKQLLIPFFEVYFTLACQRFTVIDVNYRQSIGDICDCAVTVANI